MCITPEMCTTLSKCKKQKQQQGDDHDAIPLFSFIDDISKRTQLDLGGYQRPFVSNLVDQAKERSEPGSISLPETIPHVIPNTGVDADEHGAASFNTGSIDARATFNKGLMHIFGFHHEEAAKCFLLCLQIAPDCVLAHGMVALCHSPNYNFRGQAYYDSTNYSCIIQPDPLEGDLQRDPSSFGPFPSQQMAEYHSRIAMEKIEKLRGTEKEISHVEQMLLRALRTRTCQPGVDPVLADVVIGRPYADETRNVYEMYPDDPEVAFMFADSLMVLNAWNLYEFPTGRPLTPDVKEVERVLQVSLEKHPDHAGLCHLYVHLSEMHSDPGRALPACQPLRAKFPDSGHLIHMSTHIDVLVGDYEGVVRWNMAAIEADMRAMAVAPDTAGRAAFYFGYIVHNFHMLVYGSILGGMEAIGLHFAQQLNSYLDESLFITFPDLAAYLESYSALEIHSESHNLLPARAGSPALFLIRSPPLLCRSICPIWSLGENFADRISNQFRPDAFSNGVLNVCPSSGLRCIGQCGRCRARSSKV
jgi:hypothetical protein